MKNHILPFLLSALALTLGCVATGTTEPDEATIDTTRTEVPAPSRAPAIAAVPTHTAQGDAVELVSRVDPDLEIARRVAIQLASSPSGFTKQACGTGCLMMGGLQAGGPNDEDSCGTASCCIAQDQCSVLTEAACQQFCAQNGMEPPSVWGVWGCLDGVTALCLCCHP